MAFSKLNPVVKGKWLAALQSGNYAQGQGALKRQGLPPKGYYYCCLGVLCDILDPSGWEVTANSEQAFKYGGAGGSFGSVPSETLYQINLDPQAQDRLIEMNDGQGDREYNFSEIADWIDKNL